MTDPSLALDFCGLKFDSPIVLLSGCVGFGEEYTRVEGFSNRDAGGIVLKGTTREPRSSVHKTRLPPEEPVDCFLQADSPLA